MWSLFSASNALLVSLENRLIAETSIVIHLPEPPKNILEIVAVATIVAVAWWRRPVRST